MKKGYLILALLISLFVIAGCANNQGAFYIPERTDVIPLEAVKATPATDSYPPQMHSSEYEQPVPVVGLVNTKGAEDSPFITPDGNTLYFFFTPDVTGIYVSHKKSDGDWGKASRVLLQEGGKAGLDGCEFVQASRMWFCTVREGYAGIHWFTAELVNGKWVNWKEEMDFPAAY